MTPTSMQAYFRSLVRYNQWANGLLYDACARLGEAEYKQVRHAFFKSVHGVLNHILVCDRNYHARFTGSGAAMSALDQLLYDDFTGLHVARQAEDAQLIAWINGLAESDLAAEVRYKTFAGAEDRFPLALLLGSLFNHQTHHRGQAHDLLSQTEVAPPSLDWLYYLREARDSAA
jgi:uncharacterized damage-inducible protein DinB